MRTLILKKATGCYGYLIFVLFCGIFALAASPVGDLDGNNVVDFDDLAIFAEQWLQSTGNSSADIAPPPAGDGIVNLDDFALFVRSWLERGVITLAINEFMASNSSVLQDPQEPGEYPDWIEIYNYGNEAITLAGMYLRDNNNLWQIPAGVSIQAGERILFWADDEVSQGNFHTNFKLDKSGDVVTLLAFDGQTIIDKVSFSDQETDISYGRYPDASEDWYLMDSPSPGRENNVGMAGDVYFSRLGGTFTSDFNLTLSTTSPTAQIRYTTDGSMPTQSSSQYSGPIAIGNAQTKIIRARAYQSGLAPGPAASQTYLPLASDVQNFSSNLPIVIVDTAGFNIDTENDPAIDYALRPVSAAFIDTNDTGRASVTDLADFAGRGGLKVRGDSSAGNWVAANWAKQYSFETWDEDNNNKSFSILGFPEESNWILHVPYNDKSLMRNVLAYTWSNAMGNYASRTKYVELFLNKNGGNVSMSDYWGVYILMERIKVDKNRVDIAKLQPADNNEPEISGGYIIKHDKYYPPETGFNTAQDKTGWRPFLFHDPKYYEITTQQKAWIKGYLDAFETALYGGSYTDPVNGYARYIDVDTFIDFFWMVEITKQVDSYAYSTYMYKDRNGKLKMGPAWDFNLGFGNAGPSPGESWYFSWQREAQGWYYTGAGEINAWYNRLRTDVDFNLKCADRWFELREDRFNDANIVADIDSYYNLLSAEAAARHFNRWKLYVSPATGMEVGSGGVWAPILNAWTWPNWYYGTPNNPHTYMMEANWIKTWMAGNGTSPGLYSNRLYWIDNNIGYAFPPNFTVGGVAMNKGGHVPSGSSLTMTGSTGTIYYTLDGTDPRAWTATTESVSPFNTVLAAEGAAKKVLVPAGPVSNDWKGGNEPFNDSTWNSYTFVSGKSGSVGYERASSYDGLISYDVESYLYGNGATQSCIIRIPFSVDAQQLQNMTYLTLRARHDDAFVAYINGTEVHRSTHVPDPLAWSSAATGYVDKASNLVDYDISAFLNVLHAGSNNILAIHGLNVGSTSSDFLISAQLEAGAVASGGVTPGGAISPSAIQYTGPIPLTRSQYIKARLNNGTNWGALNEACYSVGPVADHLRVTEIMYHPADPNLEFIEVQNTGAASINLVWIKFTDGIDFTFPDLTLGAGQFVVVVGNRARFEAVYGTGMTIAGQFTGALDNGGEEIVLRDAFGVEILDFDYDDDWYPVTDGAGFSLNITNALNPDRSSWDKKDSWQASRVANGSPGSANPANVAANGAIVINEIRTHSDSAPNDWIELHNTTGLTVDIGGWFISDDPANLKKYRIAAGQSISPFGYKVFTQDANFGTSAPDSGRLVGFGFSELGEQVYLSSGADGELTGGYSVWEEFEAAQLNVSFGRYTKSAATNYDVDFVQMQSMTYETANSGPLVPDVVINEIMYNSLVVQDQLGEYIELKNRNTSSDIKLFDVANPSNTWKFTKGIDYTFPTGVSIPAGGLILVVRTDPDVFRAINPSVPAGVGVYGPFVDSELDNDGEKIELSRPGTPEPGGLVPYIRVEQVNYSDGMHPVSADPWPVSADGDGQSLNRISVSSYPNDVSNWTAENPTPGL
jgi:hypothetical protein